ncbi:acyl-CoA N-acyltransferase [Mycena maculata]|uniref:Acyl-CoA N-acyltransferase n=1 Tax=Mycena maculata TaxID=230809 RepID=A0AAD7JGZ2_9AGAR|nr:acyl-CoA N-acyltransferase [Mycena maculata]
MLLSIPLISKSGRVALVPPSEVDDEAVVSLRNDPATRRFQPFLPLVSITDIRAQRTAWAADPNILPFNIHALEPSGKWKFVGVTRLHRIDRYYGNSCEVGITMSPKNFGTGLASDAMHTILEYAFEEQRLRRVTFHTAVENIIIRGWIERAGGTFEGIERDYWLDGKGGYEDVRLYSVLYREWVGGCRARMEQGAAGEKARL